MVQYVHARVKLLFAGYENYSPDDNSQHAVLFLLLCLAISVSSFFSVVNYLHGHQWLAWFQVVICAAFVPMAIRGYRRNWLPKSRAIFMCLAFLMFAALFVDGGIGNTGIYWSLLFPFLVFLLMGVRLGWRWVTAFVVCDAVLLGLHGLHVFDFTYSDDTLLYTPAMFFCFTIIACAFQLQLERRQTELQQTNLELIKSEGELRHVKGNLEQMVQKRTHQLKMINEKLSREVDEKIEALQQKEFAEIKYEHAQKMESLGTLVGGIAHDFNNMLSGITANLYLIQRKVDSPDVKERLDKIGELSMHAADMIRQLMTFARKDEVKLAEFDLRPFLNEAYKLARVSVPEHIRCELVLSEGKYFINGDGTQIQQILMNLINNARDALAGASDPFINVSLVKCSQGGAFLTNHPEAGGGNYVILTVQDNGCGIPEDKQSRVFEPFYTTKEVGKGTGLGLSMVYGAVKTHGGFIDVASYTGTGTRFSIYLPLVGSVSRARGGVQENVVEAGHGEMILLVDDDPFLLEVSEQLLVNLGYRVMTALNGLQAVETYRVNKDVIDLVLMDIVMPVLGGKPAADCILKLNPDARILFISGYDRDHDATVEMGTDWHLVLNKPLVVDELSRTLRQQLKKV